MQLPTLASILSRTQLIQPLPADLSWGRYFADPWYLTEKLARTPAEKYSDNRLSNAISRTWDISIGLATDAPKIIVYTAAIAGLADILTR